MKSPSFHCCLDIKEVLRLESLTLLNGNIDCAQLFISSMELISFIFLFTSVKTLGAIVGDRGPLGLKMPSAS